MTAAARPTDAARSRRADAAGRRRSRVVALAVVVSVSLHLLGWLLMQRVPPAGSPKSVERPRTALRVELIPARPTPEVIAREIERVGPNAGGRGNVQSAKRSAVVANAQRAARSSADMPDASHRQGQTTASASANEPATAASPDLDWRRDLDAIGAQPRTARSPAQAAVGALGASSGDTSAHRRAIDARLADGMSGARRADCRNAYAGAGLLALPMLALDAVRDTGCQW
ncbi:hypothetical protein GJG85_08995 [Burkholderia sp. MS389]|uniref:hypothetical protein n=1 Tax=Burkholderia sp. MS389 TaxID=2811789 RepID=UPI0006793EE8|nr:hypothetical protein [Burkholderia sp. MS389]KWU25368.1 hypothetical protein AS149_30695 [Burkholderia cenocepacia]QRR13532.1 hypothetical protein GJG85_08995 [Burkholderia sp. MS389]